MTEAPDVSPDFPDDDPLGDPVEDDRDDDGHGDLEDRASEVAGASEELRTGDERVDAVLDGLADLDSRPVTEHAGLFERAHEGLRDALDPDHGRTSRSA